jgi:lipoprotein-anchoring transpeptidase ErfK/SrfK
VPLSAVTLADNDIAPVLATNVGNLAVGQSATVSVTRTVNGDLTNTVTVTADAPNGDPVGDSDDAVVDAIAPAIAVDKTVSLDGYAPGTIVVKTGQRRLYYVLGGGKAIVYPVGVGRAGRTWSGTSFISGKRLRPDWAPPPELRRNRTATVIPGGSPANPMGAAALTLGSGEYAIHGTNAPGSIGGFVSYGCIRMHNSDIMDLFGRVHFGTRVVVQ